MEVQNRRPYSRLSLKDEFDFDINDISRASTPTSTMSSKSEGRRREKSHRSHSIDDYKRKIARLKSELEAEKARTKQLYRDKSSEIKSLQEAYKKEKEKEISSLETKLSQEKQKEIEIIQENITKKKDKELQEVLRYKEEEVKKLRDRFEEEKAKALRTVVESEKKQFEQNAEKMAKEIEKLKGEKKKIEENLKKKCEDQARKEKEFSEVKEGYDAELRKILTESKKFAFGNLQKLKKAERALSEGIITEDEVLSITESLSLRGTPLSEVSSRTPSRPLALCTAEDLEIEKYLASATPSPHPGSTPLGKSTPGSVSLGKSTPGSTPLGKTFTLDGKSPFRYITVQENTEEDQTKEKHKNTVSFQKSKKTLPLKNRRSSEEKDRHLQKRIAELQAQTQRLERKIGLLKTENDSLKRQKDDQRPLEEKIKTLKKRNAELAAIARRLEEKAKHLQQENMKKVKEEMSPPESDHMKKIFARQRAKDLADHAKAMLAKDREIEELRKKCQELADTLSNADFLGPENVQMYEEKEELVTIIKQAAKERLQMEKQLAKIRPNASRFSVSAQADLKKLKELETTNETLQKELGKLERAKEDTEKLEIELTQKKIECETLAEEIKKEKQRNKELESDLQESAAQNTQLTVQVSDLQHRLQDLEKVSEECNILRLNLSDAHHECDLAKQERGELQNKVGNLEETIKNLKESADRLQKLENEHQSTLQQLHEKHSQIQSLQQAQQDAKGEYDKALHSLKSRINELQQNCQQQEEKHLELTQELQTLRSAAGKNNFKYPPNHSPSHHKDLANHSPSHHKDLANHNPSYPTNHSPAHHKDSSNQKSFSVLHHFPLEENFHQSNARPLTECSRFPGSDNIQVDSTKSLDTGFADDEDLDNSNNPSPDQGKPQGEFEDPELYEIAKKLKELEASDSEEDNLCEDRGEDSGMESQKEQKMKINAIDENRLSILAKKGPIQVFQAKYSYDPIQYSPNENPDAELPINSGDYVLVYGEMDEDGFFDGELLNGKRGLVPSNFIEKVADEDLSDFHAAMSDANHHDDDSITGNSIQQDLDYDSSEEMGEKDTKQKLTDLKITRDKCSPHQSHSQSNSRPSSDHGSDIDDLDLLDSSKLTSVKVQSQPVDSMLPCPRELTLDRQLTNSIVISWKPPFDHNRLDVKSYHVYVDGVFKSLVRKNERTKALLENVDSKEDHRISVRCNSNLGQSADSQCTMLVGKGLAPATEHRVSVTADGLSINRQEKSAFVVFKTPSGGIPEPPLSVQVEVGPQEGTLLLTWLPVTIDSSGFSNGAVVTGYMVYADGRKVKEAPGPTNDHIILSADDFLGFIPRQLLVRTVTADKTESSNSDTIKLPQSLIQEITDGAAKNVTKDTPTKKPVKTSMPLNSIIPDLSEGDEDIDAVINRIAAEAERNMSPVLDNIEYEDDFIEASSTSELSDIPEEVEEEFSEEVPKGPPTKMSLQLLNGHASLSKNSDAKSQIASTPHRSNETSPKPRSSPRIPAIEITRDSGSERGNSLDISEEEFDISKSAVKKRTEPHSAKGQPRSISPVSPSASVSPSERVSNGGHSREASPHRDSHVISDLQHKNERNTSNHVPPDPRKRLYPESHVSNKNGTNSQHEQGSVKPHRRSPSHGSPRNSPQRVSPRGDPSPHRELGDSKTYSDSNANDMSQDSTVSDGRLDNSGVHHVPHLDLSDCDDSGDVDSISGEINPPIEDNRIRLFVALFDYDPDSMSPNVECLDEELPFKEGQIIKIYGDKDADGFYRGECNGRVGFVPCNMVSEVQVEDTQLAEQLLKESQTNFSPSMHLSNNYVKSTDTESRLSPAKISTVTSSTQVKKMVALYDYDPQELSPNVDAELELAFRSGDTIMIYGDMDDDGFFMGEYNGRRGLVPSNFLQEAPLSDDEVLESASIVSPARSGESLSNLSRHSDLTADKTQKMGLGSQLDQQLSHDTVNPANQTLPQMTLRSLSPEDIKQKKKSSSILSKGKNIFKKLTR
ncbi:peripheral-type benzodiazepine receptor-associated protein 1-like isoform X7 [Ostrea edulis]|uniref:peripheral-type benzodiazepine receptor-associated protein 1-like isoform X7 n=1 Tax=Ostrea edulis TaxID=37623 RepID=UPI0024AFB640|nr:peripheral-type benzodiazepine receptor-associated protein 1-like isoform X7 [Ostrea edulis]